MGDAVLRTQAPLNVEQPPPQTVSSRLHLRNNVSGDVHLPRHIDSGACARKPVLVVVASATQANERASGHIGDAIDQVVRHCVADSNREDAAPVSIFGRVLDNLSSVVHLAVRQQNYGAQAIIRHGASSHEGLLERSHDLCATCGKHARAISTEKKVVTDNQNDARLPKFAVIPATQ